MPRRRTDFIRQTAAPPPPPLLAPPYALLTDARCGPIRWRTRDRLNVTQALYDAYVVFH